MKLNIKQIFLTICVFAFCIFDWLLGSLAGQIPVNCAILVFTFLGIIIISHYSYKDFLNVPCYIWTFISVIAFPLFIWWNNHNANSYQAITIQWCIDTITILLFGYVMILTLRTYLIDKKRPLINLGFLLLFVIFILLVLFSRNDNQWTKNYLMILLLIYITPFTKEEHSDFIPALINGVILGFFFLQSAAYVIDRKSTRLNSSHL